MQVGRERLSAGSSREFDATVPRDGRAIRNVLPRCQPWQLTVTQPCGLVYEKRGRVEIGRDHVSRVSPLILFNVDRWN